MRFKTASFYLAANFLFPTAFFVVLMSALISPAVAARPKTQLAPLAAEPIPLGAIKPAGWLRAQLEIQASGLGGHLDEFWPDVAESSWIGGKAEGWERGPYWLDGFVPLAIHLGDERLKARAQKWVDYILVHQKEDGWLGPMKGNPDPNSRLSQYDVWPRFILLKALTQWQEATGDQRIVPAMQRFLRRLAQVLEERPLEEWARVRWADLSVSIYWLFDRTREPWLLELGAKTRAQGLDWAKLARDYPFTEKVTRKHLEGFKQAAGGRWINDNFGATHGVNLGMGLKAPSVWSRQSGKAADRKAIGIFLDALDKYHGQATGVFACDEHVAGRHPSQGTELCTVVEMMYSLATALAVEPDVALADRLESLAFNALPATFTDDMWAHQYDQQANQVICKVSPEHIYSNNGPEANLFGLEPNFGCCLANMHQGWPKFASHLWMKSADGGLQAMAYAPCDLHTRLGNANVRIQVRTEYPFAETIVMTVNTDRPARFPLHLRVPQWAEGALLQVGTDDPKKVPAGKFHRLTRRWDKETRVTLRLPLTPRVERRFNDSVTVHRGPIVFALKVGEDWRKLRDRKVTADWEVFPTSPWNYALLLDPKAPEKSLRVELRDIPAAIFSSKAPPVRILAKARRIPGWQIVKNAADAPPQSPVETNETIEEVELVPYAAAKLRVTEIPLAKD